MPDPAIEIRNLSKTFQVARRKKSLAVDHTTISALRQLVAQVVSPHAAQEDAARYRVVEALDRFSLDVMPGEVVGIIGRNGAGKSTLLKILARVIEPTSGFAKMRGRVVSLLELGLGFSAELTVRENIYLYGQLAGLAQREIRGVEETILDFAELARHRDVPLAQCPSGSFIRLAFAAMIGIDPDVILADEILAVGDAKFRSKCEERIQNAGASGEAVLFVSHDMEAIRRCCTRAVWIDHGRIRMEGTTAGVTRAYQDDILGGHREVKGSGAILDLRATSSSGSPVGAIQLDSTSFLETVFRLRPETVGRVRYRLFLGETLIVETTSPWSRLAGPGGGTFRFALEMPPHLMNDCAYRLSATLEAAPARDAEPEACDQVEMEIQVMNSDNANSVWADWDWSRRGLLSPRLNWSHDAMEAADVG